MKFDIFVEKFFGIKLHKYQKEFLKMIDKKVKK